MYKSPRDPLRDSYTDTPVLGVVMHDVYVCVHFFYICVCVCVFAHLQYTLFFIRNLGLGLGLKVSYLFSRS